MSIGTAITVRFIKKSKGTLFFYVPAPLHPLYRESTKRRCLIKTNLGKLTEVGKHMYSVFRTAVRAVRCEGAIFSVLRIFYSDYTNLNTNPKRLSWHLT